MEMKPPAPGAGSFGALIAAYRNSPEWKILSERMRGERERDIKRIREMWEALPVQGLEIWHVFELRDSYADLPGAANNLVSTLSAMIA
jgi:hypothetical protein